MIDALLRAPTTAFVLVRARARATSRCARLSRELARMGILIRCGPVNRSHRVPQRRAIWVASRPAARLREAVLRMEADSGCDSRAPAEAHSSACAPARRCRRSPVFRVAAREIDVASLHDIAQIAGELGY